MGGPCHLPPSPGPCAVETHQGFQEFWGSGSVGLPSATSSRLGHACACFVLPEACVQPSLPCRSWGSLSDCESLVIVAVVVVMLLPGSMGHPL